LRRSQDGELAVQIGHGRRQVVGPEQPGFQDLARVQGQTAEPAGQGGLVVDLNAVLVAAADLDQPPDLDGQAGFLANFPRDGVLVPLALPGVAGRESPLPGRRPEACRSSSTRPSSARTIPM
jgi:hypothetical protein